MSLTDQHKPLPSRAVNRKRILRLSLGALFVSLSIILTRFASITPFPTIRIGFGSLPIQIAGVILGPVSGAVVGIIADPLGFVMHPQGTYHPGFTFSSALNGLIPGLIAWAIYRLPQKNNKPQRARENKYRRPMETLWIALYSTLILTALCSILLNTLWLSQLLGTDYLALLVARLPAVLISAAVHLATLVLILPALDRAGASRIRRLNSN